MFVSNFDINSLFYVINYMKNKTEINDDEINLVELLIIVWEGKLKIIAAVLISVLSIIFYINSQPKNFIASTYIYPISSIEEYKYSPFNLFNYDSIEEIINPVIKKKDETKIIINTNENDQLLNNYGELNDFKDLKTFELTASKFLEQYLSILNEKKIFEDAIRKYKLLDIKNYSNIKDYEEAINLLASSIKIIMRGSQDKDNINVKEGFEVTYATIEFRFEDKNKWKLVLEYVDKTANQIVKQSLNKQFERLILNERMKKKYLIEDISKKIENLKIDYEIETKNRISYLQEQSEIAKELGIAKNTIEVQPLGNDNTTFLSTVSTSSPLYLRGYEAINKEIELIKLRKNKDAFIEDLLEISKIKRKLEQNKTLDRAELIFETTPLAINDNFFAASIKVKSTTFEYKNNQIKIMISAIIGFIIGLFFVLISNAIRNHK